MNVQNAPGHQDNQGVVVSHVGLNVDRYWEDFKQIDQDDQELVAGWLEAEDTAPPTGKRRSRRRLRPDMNVTQEIIDRFISDPYLDPNDDTLIDNALIVLREQGIDLVALGIDREDLRQRMLSARAKAGPQEPERLPVQPQAHRKVLRARLREQAKSAAARICEALGHRVGGRRIAALGGTGAANNLAAVIALMNRAVNDRLGIDSGQRRDLTIDELETVIPLLDDIADEVESDLRSRLAK